MSIATWLASLRDGTRSDDATWMPTGGGEPPPKVLSGRYQVGREIGRGSFSRVHEAHDPVLHRKVAVKIYEPHVHAAISRQEIDLQSNCQHPNLMPLLDAGTDPASGRPYIVMPLYPGEDLETHIRRVGAMPVRKALRCVDQICSALEFLQRRRHAIHGDVKPGNIWLTAEGSALLMDFNLRGAIVVHPDKLAGTPGYVAPEVHEGRRDHRSDVFSLGCVLYYALTGHPPFEPRGGPPRRLPARPSRLRPDLYPWLDDLVITAVALEPQQRFQTAGEMRVALRCPPRGARPWLWPLRLWFRGSWIRLAGVVAGVAASGVVGFPHAHLFLTYHVGIAVLLAWVGQTLVGRMLGSEAVSLALATPAAAWSGVRAHVPALLQAVALLLVWRPFASGHCAPSIPWIAAACAIAWIASLWPAGQRISQPAVARRIAMGVVAGGAATAASIATRQTGFLDAVPLLASSVLGPAPGIAAAFVGHGCAAVSVHGSCMEAILAASLLATACYLCGSGGGWRIARVLAAGAIIVVGHAAFMAPGSPLLAAIHRTWEPRYAVEMACATACAMLPHLPSPTSSFRHVRRPRR